MSSIRPGDLTGEAFTGDLLSELGWKNFAHDDPEVTALRQQLEAEAGIPDLEVVDPAVQGYGKRAAELLERDGFVVIKDVLGPERLAKLRRGCEIAIREMVGRDPVRAGNRGSHRYSFGSSPAHFGLFDYWATMIDPPPLTEILEEIFGTRDYVCVSGSVGGDFNVPGSTEYQQLHSDGGYRDVKLEYQPDGRRVKVDPDAPEDPRKKYMRELPVREHHVTANYPLEICKGSDVGHTQFNGVTRQIPGTQHSDERSGEPIPSLKDEPKWMKLSTAGPCPAGSVMLRDSRAWHGGTPNLGRYVRAIPCAIFALPQELGGQDTGWVPPVRTLPYDVWETMTAHGQHICRQCVAEEGAVVDVPWQPDFERTVDGGGTELHTGHKVARL